MERFEKHQKIITNLVKFGYAIGCAALYLVALLILGYSIYHVFIDVRSSSFSIYKILDEIALIIFSIAALDVAKYLAIEEVLRRSHKISSLEEKESLTKFVIIISTAIALEGLVLTIETSKGNLEQLVFPVILLLTSAVFIITIGVYKKLTKHEEKR
jgi:hypothetical protein